jgi:hypothetical protein
LGEVGAAVPVLVRDDDEVDIAVAVGLATGDGAEDQDGVCVGHGFCGYRELGRAGLTGSHATRAAPYNALGRDARMRATASKGVKEWLQVLSMTAWTISGLVAK